MNALTGNRTLLFAILLSYSSACVSDASIAARQYGLTPPFNPHNIRERSGHPDTEGFSCKHAPRPLRDLQLKSIYSEESDNASIIDPDAYEIYNEALSPLRSFESGISSMANRYLRSNPPRTATAACVLDWIDSWARQEALLGEVNRMGEAVRKWSLASVSTAWIQIRDEPGLNPAKKRRAEKWIRTLARTVIRDYSTDTDLPSRRNNHLYWAAWAVTAAGIALDDRDMFDWGMGMAKTGIGQIETDGSLPLEMKRGQMALGYHAFAATPLFMLAEAGMANGVNLYTENNGGLFRLARLILSGLDDPKIFAKPAGAAQNTERVYTESSLAWLEPYYRRSSDADALRWIEKLPPQRLSRIGGEARILYRN